MGFFRARVLDWPRILVISGVIAAMDLASIIKRVDTKIGLTPAFAP